MQINNCAPCPISRQWLGREVFDEIHAFVDFRGIARASENDFDVLGLTNERRSTLTSHGDSPRHRLISRAYSMDKHSDKYHSKCAKMRGHA